MLHLWPVETFCSETAINFELPSIAFSAQAYNWLPLNAGAAASYLCIRLAWYMHGPIQEVYLRVIDGDGWTRVLRNEELIKNS